MKGKILHFSIPENQGVISGDDGNRYTFSGKEWKSEALPQPGRRVDFDTAGQTATAIFQDSTEVAIYEGLYRSSDERCIAGVCGGLAHKWNISKTGLRVAAFFTMFFFGIIIPIYIVCWILFPSRPTENS